MAQFCSVQDQDEPNQGEKKMMNKMFRKISPVVVILGIGVALGVAATIYHFQDTEARIRSLQQANHELETEKARLEAEKLHLEFVADMANQFSITPDIVDIVYTESRDTVDPTLPEWRLIQTPEFMTYLMLSVIHAESKGNPQAIGDGGRARGLTQIWVSTARQYGEVSAQELLDPATNLEYSFKHFNYLLERYRGNLALTLYAWNRGEGTVDKLISYGEVPVNGYGVKVYRAALSPPQTGG